MSFEACALTYVATVNTHYGCRSITVLLFSKYTVLLLLIKHNKLTLSPVSVCLLTGLLKKTTDQNFMNFYGMAGCNPGTSRDSIRFWMTLTQGQGN